MHRPGHPVGRRHRAGRRTLRVCPPRLRSRNPRADRAALPLRRVRRRADRRTRLPGRGRSGRPVRRVERAAGHPARADRLLHRRPGRAGRGSRTDGRDVDRRPADLAHDPRQRPGPDHPHAVRRLVRRARGDHGARAELGARRGDRAAPPHVDLDGRDPRSRQRTGLRALLGARLATAPGPSGGGPARAGSTRASSYRAAPADSALTTSVRTDPPLTGPALTGLEDRTS